jgi:hypothetical protein
MPFPNGRAYLAPCCIRSARIVCFAFILIFSCITTSLFSFAADKNKNNSRPTVRVAAGSRYDFCQYAAGNGNTYGPNCKLKIDDIQKAWADVSDVVIDGIFEIKRTDPTQRVAAVFVVNKLTIENGGRIVTNGNALYIFANEFVALNTAAIISFESNNLKAANGAPQTGTVGSQGNAPGANGLTGLSGNSGTVGESGGSVTIFANNFSGPVLINLAGQKGGDGSQGGPGGNGLMGFKGEDPDDGIIDCHHAGGGGGPGGNGGYGGKGGDAGRGGDGGLLGFFYVTSTSVDPPNNPQVSLITGIPGSPGPGGAGGSPGEGGLGGNGKGHCGGGPRGTWGGSGGTQGPGAQASGGVNGSSQIIKLASMAKIQDSFKKAVAL